MIDYTKNKAIRRREYSKIFTGSNSDSGYQNIYLSFVASTKEFTFDPSKFTYFHYPMSAPYITVQDADLVSEGATPGTSPFRADKIFKKLADYEDYSPWGNSSGNLDQKGTWLCTWLSSTSGVPVRPRPVPPPRGPSTPITTPPDVIQTPVPRFSGPVWMDRYYDPGYISLQQALTATQEIYINSVHVLYDKTSDLTFDPGVLYMYHHIGDNENNIIVENLSIGNEQISVEQGGSRLPRPHPTGPGPSPPEPTIRLGQTETTFLPPEDLLKLSIKDWTIDSSAFGNNGILSVPEAVRQEVIQDVTSTTLQLSSGTNVDYRVPFDDSYNQTDKFTVNCWVKAEDWGNVKGNQIFGNYFRGGWGLEVSTWFPRLTSFLPLDPIDNCPLMGVFEISKGHLLFGNQAGKFYQDKLVQSTVWGETVRLSGIHVSSDFYFWTFTNGLSTKMLYKIDYDGDVIETYNYPLTYNIVDFTFDSKGNPYVLNTATSPPKIYQHDPDTLAIVNTTNANPGDTKIGIWHFDQLITYAASALMVDYQGNYWTIRPSVPPGIPNMLWRWNTPQTWITGLDNFATMKVDPDGYMWILSGTRNYQKLDIKSFDTASLSFSGTIGFNDTLGNREIGFTKEFVNGEYVNYGWIVQEADRAMYKINPSTCEVLDVIDLTNKLNFYKYPAIQTDQMRFAAKGDFTGTQWAYRFQGPQAQAQNRTVLYWRIAFQLPSGDIEERKIAYDTTDLTDDAWTMVTLTYDIQTGKAIIYNNTVVAGFEMVPPGSKIYFKYRNPLIFGGNSGRFYSLDEEMGSDQLHFNGSIAEPVIYHRALTQADITYLYYQKLKARPVKWNAPIGKQVFIEEIERFFKHKLPGSKSNFYNLSLVNFGITDPDVKQLIEGSIRKTIKRVAPAHTELLKINWS